MVTKVATEVPMVPTPTMNTRELITAIEMCNLDKNYFILDIISFHYRQTKYVKKIFNRIMIFMRCLFHSKHDFKREKTLNF